MGKQYMNVWSCNCHVIVTWYGAVDLPGFDWPAWWKLVPFFHQKTTILKIMTSCDMSCELLCTSKISWCFSWSCFVSSLNLIHTWVTLKYFSKRDTFVINWDPSCEWNQNNIQTYRSKYPSIHLPHTMLSKKSLSILIPSDIGGFWASEPKVIVRRLANENRFRRWMIRWLSYNRKRAFNW